MDVMSVDVENWWDGNLLPRGTAGDEEDVLRETQAVLELLAAHRARATFFVLGVVAARHPQIVRRMAAEGHEVACHGWDHTLVRELTPKAFGQGIRRAKALLEDIAGMEVRAHRAPSWSIGADTPWAPDVLLEAGFTDDSSIFPVRGPLYGVKGAPLHPYLLCAGGGELREWPPATRAAWGVRVPVAGGAYWAVLPYAVVRWGLAGEGIPRVAYIHPWSLAEKAQAGVEALPRRLRWTVLGGRRRHGATLRRLLDARDFTTLSEASRAYRPSGRYRLGAGGLVPVGEDGA